MKGEEVRIVEVLGGECRKATNIISEDEHPWPREDDAKKAHMQWPAGEGFPCRVVSVQLALSRRACAFVAFVAVYLGHICVFV